MVQNDKKLCPLHSLSQEQYIIGLSFMAHMCKMIISAGFFSSFFFFLFFFFNFFFFGLSVGKRAKNVPKSQKILSVVLYISGTMHYVISFMVHMCKMIISPIFFLGQKIVQNNKESCLSHSVSQKPYIIWCDFWYTCVKWWYLLGFLSFFKVLIFHLFRSLKGQKMA